MYCLLEPQPQSNLGIMCFLKSMLSTLQQLDEFLAFQQLIDEMRKHYFVNTIYTVYEKLKKMFIGPERLFVYGDQYNDR